MFDLHIFERLGFILLWFGHGAILGSLSFVTVVAYMVTAMVKYEDSNYSTMTEIGIALGVYIGAQAVFFILSLSYAMDTILFLVAQEFADLCAKYGTLCVDYKVFEPANGSDIFTEADGTSLSNNNWEGW